MSANGYADQAHNRQTRNSYSRVASQTSMSEFQRPEPARWQHHQYHNGQMATPGEGTLNAVRLEALNEVNEAKFSRFYVRACLIAGVGFFTDSYDIFAINIASTMIGYIYGGDRTLNTRQDLGVKIATQVGVLFGQLIFGFLADRYGRRRMYGIELVVMVFTTLSQALAGRAPGVGIVGVLVVWRFVMGVAIGGDYPLSAVITSEFAPVHLRGRLMAGVFANQGLGQLTAALVALIVTAAGKRTSTVVSLDIAWRILLGIGCVPGALAMGMRYTIPESPRFIMDISRDVEKATEVVQQYLRTGSFSVDSNRLQRRAQAPQASWMDFLRYFSNGRNLKTLVAVCYSWFIIDFAYYGLALNSSTILQAIQFSQSVKTATDPKDALTALFKIAQGNLILSAAGLLPGYLCTILLIDRWGRRPIQFTGFAALFVIFAIMGFGFPAFAIGSDTTSGDNKITAGIKAYVFLYCLAYFFQNFGPNTTTFIIPGEMFPTRYRTTIHGIAAATGKLGAIVVQVIFELTIFTSSDGDFDDLRRVRFMFVAFAFVMLSGIASTYFTPETKQKSLEELSNEDQSTFIKGAHLTLIQKSWY